MVGALGFVAASIGGAWVLRAATDDLVIPAFDDGTVDRSDVWVVMGLIVVVSVGRGIGVMMRRWYLSLAENSTNATGGGRSSTTTSMCRCGSIAAADR